MKEIQPTLNGLLLDLHLLQCVVLYCKMSFSASISTLLRCIQTEKLPAVTGPTRMHVVPCVDRREDDQDVNVAIDTDASHEVYESDYWSCGKVEPPLLYQLSSPVVQQCSAGRNQIEQAAEVLVSLSLCFFPPGKWRIIPSPG